MRTTITNQDATTGQFNQSQPLSSIGLTSTCDTYRTIDYANGEYISNVTFFYDAFRVKAVYVMLNTGGQLQKGTATSSMTMQEFLFTEEA